MGLKSSKILGISVTTDSKKDILEYIEKYFEETDKGKRKTEKEKSKPLVIVTPNPEQIVAAHRDPHFAKILNQADVALPDGIGLIFATKISDFSHSPITRHPSLTKIPGVEFMEDLVQMVATKGCRIGLIGGRGRVAVRALECLQARFPGVKGWAEEPGDVDPGNLGNLGDLVEKILKTNTKIVFVGLGAPKQEFFIEKLQETCSKSPASCLPLILMSVGGAFDMIAGRVKRAPLVFRALGLEWLWRLVHEPWRWRRQLLLLKFFWLVLKKKEQV